MEKYDEFYSLLRFIKSSVSFPYPIKIRRTKMPKGLDGDCQLKKNYFLIRIDKNLPEYYCIDVAIHEFGHCLAWNKDSNAHGHEWGKAYSTIYRKFLEWIEYD